MFRLLITVFIFSSFFSLAQHTQTEHEMAQLIFHQINTIRVLNELDEVEFNDDDQKVALLHSEEMRKYNFFNHNHPRKKKIKSLRNRYEYYGINFSRISENIVWVEFFVDEEDIDQLSDNEYLIMAKKVADVWMNSTGHRKNILGEFDTSGLACYFRWEKDKLIITATQVFRKAN